MRNSIESRISFAEKESARKKQTAVFAGTLIFFVTILIVGLYFTFPLWPFVKSSNSVVQNIDDSEENTATHEVSTAQRDTFKQQLKIFQNKVEPALLAASVATWATDAHDKIFEYKEGAMRAFSAGNYSSATALLQSAFESTDYILQLTEEKFRLYMDIATRAFESGDSNTAQANITQALLLKPGDTVAKALKARIDVLPEILRLSALASKARAENDFKALKAHLQEIIRLDPAQADLKIQLQAVTQKVTGQEFASHIANGIEAVSRRDLQTAQKYLLQANRIFPTRKEVALLNGDVQQLSREISLQNHLHTARAAIIKDDWANAYVSYRKAQAVDDTDVIAANGVRLAGRILDIHKEIVRYQMHPQRLSSGNVANVAKAALQRAKKLYQESPSLAADSHELLALITDYSTPLEIVVHSDNKTNILVRGVGNVGKTLQRTVSLKPGIYTFEGKRPGYKSKLIQVEVNRDGELPEVILVCDEPV